MEFLRMASLLLATVSVGVMVGVMFLYSNTIMPGLRRTDDRTFVGAFQAIDTAIINPIFLSTFFGGLVFTVLAAVLHLGDDFDSALPWIIAGLIIYFPVIVITLAVNVPLNDAIKAAGRPDDIDVGQTRSDFGEARWLRFNHIRTVLTLAAFVCLAWALVLVGRATG